MDYQSTIAIGDPLPGGVRGHAEDLEFALDFFRASQDYRSEFIWNAQEVLDNYLVRPLGARHAIPYIGSPLIAEYPSASITRTGRARLKDPESHQNVENLAAQALLLQFGSRDYLQATGVGQDDYDKGRLISRLLMAVLESEGNYRTFYQAWKDSWIFGTAILEFGWERRRRQEISPVSVINPDTGRPEVRYAVQNVISREGPLIGQTDFWDFYPDPTGTRIQKDMLVVGKRFRITRQEAESLAEANVYSKAAVKEATSTAPKDSIEKHTGPMEERFWDYNKRVPEKYGMMLGLELWGTVPYKTPDGLTNRVVTLLNGVPVRSTVNPHLRGIKPFQEIVVNPMTGRFYGLSPTEVNRFAQESTDHALNSLTEIIEYMVRQPLLVGQTFQGDLDRLRRREFNDVIDCMDPKAVEPIPTDFRGAQMITQELGRRKMSMREAAGETASAQQLSQIDRAAATQVSEIVRLATQRTELQVMLSERDIFPFIGRTLHNMLRQFGPRDGFLATLNGEALDVPFESIDVDADIRFVGSRNAMSKFQRFRVYSELARIVSEAMPLIPHMPEVFVRMFRDGADIADAEALIRQAVQSITAAQQQQAQAEAASSGRSGSIARGGGEPRALTPAGAAEQEGQLLA